jgi:GDPmannose 4,6-dehydratase
VKIALITGISGQDGSYLAELLLSKDYQVFGMVRRSSSVNTWRLDGIFEHPHLHLVYGDVTDANSVRSLFVKAMPDEVYHLAAQSHVRISFDVPAYTTESIALGTTNLLEALREIVPQARYYQASSSEMFGSSPPPQSEMTGFRPRSPYACAKVFAYHMAQNYREGYGLHISNGILFNHESPRRGETFVSRKIAKAAARIAAGKQDRLRLGNLDARRDWGWAPEYVEAMWLMLQQERPGDYAIATGESRSVRDLAEAAFEHAGLSYKAHVDIDDRLFRPTEVESLLGDPASAWLNLGWRAQVTFETIVQNMVLAEMEEARSAA